MDRFMTAAARQFVHHGLTQPNDRNGVEGRGCPPDRWLHPGRRRREPCGPAEPRTPPRAASRVTGRPNRGQTPSLAMSCVKQLGRISGSGNLGVNRRRDRANGRQVGLSAHPPTGTVGAVCCPNGHEDTRTGPTARRGLPPDCTERAADDGGWTEVEAEAEHLLVRHDPGCIAEAAQDAYDLGVVVVPVVPLVQGKRRGLDRRDRVPRRSKRATAARPRGRWEPRRPRRGPGSPPLGGSAGRCFLARMRPAPAPLAACPARCPDRVGCRYCPSARGTEPRRPARVDDCP